MCTSLSFLIVIRMPSHNHPEKVTVLQLYSYGHWVWSQHAFACTLRTADQDSWASSKLQTFKYVAQSSHIRGLIVNLCQVRYQSGWAATTLR